ncbi:MAG: tetratricopeptide repeat protein [Magnetococcales bacterium]|nr:tetratricopeptide repeat protein [Magnetococcales bacterium]
MDGQQQLTVDEAYKLPLEFNHGAILHKQSRFDEATISYKKALAINPDHVDVHFNIV